MPQSAGLRWPVLHVYLPAGVQMKPYRNPLDCAGLCYMSVDTARLRG